MSLTLNDQGWRAYKLDEDWDRLLDLLIASHAAGLADSEFTSTGLRGLLNRPDFDTSRFTRILLDDAGKALAFGVLWRGRVLGMLVHPDAHGRAEAQLLDWARNVAGAELGALVRDDNKHTLGLVEAAGMHQTGGELRMVRDLGEPIPEPALPEGYTIDIVRGEAELPAWVDLYNRAFGATDIPGPTTVERWTARLRDPDYDPSLNIVVRDGSGTLVSMCFCSTMAIENQRLPVKQGRTEPIATLEEHRGKGLATAAILTGLHRLKAAGMHEALLTTDLDNHNAHRLYAALGYRVAYRALWFSSQP